jgi:TatD DNase family protein
MAAFSAPRLAELLATVPLIGEVGLDRRSKVPMTRQRSVLREVLEVAAETSRLVSVHSVGATAEVLKELKTQPTTGTILHWWRGSADETREAVELNCYFSLNGAEARKPKVLSLVPRERVLTETDYPHTERGDRAASRPGGVATIEAALATAWGEEVAAVRRQLWLNLAELCRATRTSALMPHAVQASLLTVA